MDKLKEGSHVWCVGFCHGAESADDIYFYRQELNATIIKNIKDSDMGTIYFDSKLNAINSIITRMKELRTINSPMNTGKTRSK